jgi:hypothetical protein
VYHVGRTMFETERLPAPLAAYSEYVDEVSAWLVGSTSDGDDTVRSCIPALHKSISLQLVNAAALTERTRSSWCVMHNRVTQDTKAHVGMIQFCSPSPSLTGLGPQ